MLAAVPVFWAGLNRNRHTISATGMQNVIDMKNMVITPSSYPSTLVIFTLVSYCIYYCVVKFWGAYVQPKLLHILRKYCT